MDNFDYAVIGAGPGGYVSAIRAAQLGLKAVLIEKNGSLGGVCLNIGCIPSKALLESSEWYYAAGHKFAEHGISGEVGLDLPAMMRRKDTVVKNLTDGLIALMKKNKIEVVKGVGSLSGPDKIAVDPGTGKREIQAKTIVLATGSEPVELPFMKFDGKTIVSSTEALSFAEVPKHLIVVGAGAIGLELGSVWARLGARVSVVEMLPQIAPFADRQIAVMLQRCLEKQGFSFHLSAKVAGATTQKGQVILNFDGEKESLTGDKVLVAVGRRPNSRVAGMEALGIKLDSRGFIAVDQNHETAVPGIYAIGDVTPGPMLAHKAEEEGIAVAEIAAGKAGHVNYGAIPNVVYSSPELAMVGITEEEAKRRNYRVNIGKFYFRGNGRAMSMGETDGLVKMIADAETDRLLGVHILGPRASEIIAEIAVAFEFSASAEDIARCVHAHPTLAEAIREAALAVDKRAIHG